MNRSLQIPITEGFEEDIRSLFRTIGRETLEELKKDTVKAKEFMNMQETCKYMGISNPTLNQWINEKKLPVIAIEGKKFISKNTLHEWIKTYEK